MSKSAFKKFVEDFWIKYKKKDYQTIIENVPTFLQFKCQPETVFQHQQLCIFTIISMKNGNKYAKDILIKYQNVLACAHTGTDALHYFNHLQYVTCLSNLSEAIDTIMLGDMVTTVLDKLQRPSEWTEDELMRFKKFVVVIVEMESLLDEQPKFTLATKAIEYIASNIPNKEKPKNGWPEYLLDTLRMLMLHKDESPDVVRFEVVQKFKNLVNEKHESRQDIGIMMAQVICACTSLISDSPHLFIKNVFMVLGLIYDLIRDKSITPCKYQATKIYANCCERMLSHIGLDILKAIRKIFVGTLHRNTINEVIVSAASNHILAESAILETWTCKNRAPMVGDFDDTLKTIALNVDTIMNKCGPARAKLTIERCLSAPIISVNTIQELCDALVKVGGISDTTREEINRNARCILQIASVAKQTFNMHKIHSVQASLNDPAKFNTISVIMKQLPFIRPKIDAALLQLMQLTTEIDYPKLPETYRRKLIENVRKMDFYKSDRCCYINLIESNVCYLECMTNIQHYKSNVELKDSFAPLNDLVSLKNEIDIVKKLVEAFDYLAKFLQEKDRWCAHKDKDYFILRTEKLLQRIGETLTNRQYKELAMPAFNLLYQLAKTADNPLNQIFAAGYLIENIALHSTISEKEIATELQSLIMGKLRDVNQMSVDELGQFLLSFLQLTMYTIRYQYNIEHAKKYMQAINKLLNKYDSKQEQFLPVRLKYSEAMFVMIVRDSKATITPVTFIEDIFHRFTKIKYVSTWNFNTVPGIIFDLITTLYAFTQPRYEFRYANSLLWTLHSTSIRNGYLFLLAKTTILSCSESLLTEGKHLESQLNHLDTLFGCKMLAVKAESKLDSKSESDVPKMKWNKEISSLIHPDNCKCFQCTNKHLILLKMEVAAVKAWAIYNTKDYQKSLQSFQQIYDHWKATNASSYSAMLMNYSNCLVSNRREEKSKNILSEALDACDDYAQAQDISIRLLCNAVKAEIQIVEETKSYANESRPKAAKPKSKSSCKPNVLGDINRERRAYNKKSNLRN